jgi:tRNA-modifying protein YgfZ
MTRTIWHIAGTDALPFLQGLVTNDVLPLKDPGIVYAALLSPQGKYLADFFVVNTGDALLIDIAEPLASTTLRRLTMYKLRADVQFTPVAMPVARGLGPRPDGAFIDPRTPAMGWRAYGMAQTETIDWDALRIANLVPETGRELTPDDSYILEMGFERLHGVDFRKGCYVGQEVTARMKHKTDLRKGLARVQVTGVAVEGTDITADGKPVGTLHTIAGDKALAYLRFDRADQPLMAGSACVVWLP